MTDPAQHPARTVTVTAPPEAWAKLLAALPHCPCGALAEVEYHSAFACLGCVASSLSALGKPVGHVDAATAIADALSPSDASGSWETR